jgi:hypothetical protein
MTDVDLRYPIGRFVRPTTALDEAARASLIDDLERLPLAIRDAVRGMSEADLALPYRPGGWTVRQVVHHVPDSHMNAYIRYKLAVTEEVPTIKPYAEDRWAELPDGRVAPIEGSLTLLDALHVRWVRFLRQLSPEEFAREYRHPDMGVVRLDTALALYSWHGKHHTAHIHQAKTR